VTETALLVVGVSVPLLTANKKPLPTMFKARPENTATPLVADTVIVPHKVPPPGLPARSTVSLPLKPVAILPSASSAVTVNPKPLPAVTVVGGWLVKNNCAAAPGVTEIALLVAEVRP
jgi:hypothetical protein